MKARKILGAIFLIFGAAFLLNSRITGFVIVEEISGNFGFVLSLAFFVTGVLMLITEEEWWDRYRINLTVREYESGSIGPVDAALKINKRIRNITGIRYRHNEGNTIRTAEGEVSLPRLEDKGKDLELALAIYEIAIFNDPRNKRNCEIHLSKRASTKHHKKGFESLLEDFESKHEEELEMARAA